MADKSSMTINWNGFKEFQDLLDQITDDFGEKDASNILRSACRSAMVPVLNAARQLLIDNDNVDTGQLLKSLQVESRKPTSKDKRSIYTTPTMVMISRVTVAPGNKFQPDVKGEKRLLSRTFKNKKTNKLQHMVSDARAIAIEFGTAKWRKGNGMPFIRPALERHAVDVTNSLGDSLGNALIKYKSRHMGTK
jgi:hypothetical protein